MTLFELTKGIELEIPETTDMTVEIGTLCHNSRMVTEDSLFVCIRGAVADGHRYAPSAYGRGCRFFVAEHPIPELPEDATVLICPNTRIALAELSARFFGNPADELTIIGITGTKGKTTTALMIYDILNSAGLPCGYIGSNGIRYGSFYGETANTTPESYDLHQFMREMVAVGIRYLAIEVSSQALYQHRVHGIKFDICLFTNLSEDHIGGNEHPDFEHYKNCKKTLFRDYSAQTVIFNADDSYGEEMISEVAAQTHITNFAIKNPAAHRAADLTLYRDTNTLGVHFTYFDSNGSHEVTLGTPGKFSVYNALAAIAVCRECGLAVNAIIDRLRHIEICGRFETVPALPNVTFIIDYAHNRVSLMSALETLRLYDPHRLICLFGSVGGRTKGRRVEMGAVAAELADLCILTSDNPDSEDPEQIISDIASQFRFGCPYVRIPDRAEAIRYAVSIAEEGDIFLFAGKGHEDYQLVFGKKIPFSERGILLEAARDKRKTPAGEESIF